MGGGRGSSTIVQLAMPADPGDHDDHGGAVGPGAASAKTGTAAQIMSSRKPLNLPLTPD